MSKALETLSSLALWLTAIVVLLVLTAAHWLGLLYNLLIVLVLASIPVVVVARLIAAGRKNLDYAFLRHPLRRGHRLQTLQVLNRWACLLLVGAMLSLAVIPIQFEPEEYVTILGMLWAGLGVLMLLELVPPRRVRLSTNLVYLVGTLFLLFQLVQIQAGPFAPEPVVLDAPFRGEWYVFQGGRSALLNHHYPIRAQRYALDLVALEDGREWTGEEDRLESYAAFRQPIFAPVRGRVLKVVEDLPDVPIGETDASRPAGNHIVIDLADGRCVLLAHLMHESVVVAEGDMVESGQPIARCGNSGNTSAPHLHLQVQSRVNIDAPDLWTSPIVFRNATVHRGDRALDALSADLRRNDRVFVPATPEEMAAANRLGASNSAE